MAVSAHPPHSPHLAHWLFSVSRHFDTIEVIKAELQVVLNILTEQDFQYAFTFGRSAENGA
jgi:hypothetical protein